MIRDAGSGRFPHRRLLHPADSRLRAGGSRNMHNFDLEKNPLFLYSLGHRTRICG